MRKLILMFAAISGLVLGVQAFADPPPWAPAHGWRDKHEDEDHDRRRHDDDDEDDDRGRYYVGYSGAHYDRDFDIGRGGCNREQVGAVLGGVVGGVIGNQVAADREDRVVATIIGAAVGALVGAKIGRDMDDGDRACFGHALELGVTGRPVVWTNERNHVRYQLVPGDGSRDGGRVCRRFTLLAVDGRDRVSRRGMACQSSRGVWEMARR